jgi:hypothetical protein
MKMSNLTDKLTDLARLRETKENLQARVDFVSDALKRTAEYEQLELAKNELALVSKLADDVANEIRDSVHTEMEIPSGITIKQFKVLKIADAKKAKVWMATNAPTLLSYNDSKLLKAVENLEVDWAVVTTEPRVQIASDLSVYLPKEE